MSMFEDIFFLERSIFTAQGPSESDLGISMRRALFFFDEHVRL